MGEMMMKQMQMRGRSGSAGSVRPQVGTRRADEAGEGFTAARSALDDPNLANVSIVGLIYIFNKPPDPPPAPATTQPVGTTQPVAGTTPAAGTPSTPAESAATGADAADKSDSARVTCRFDSRVPARSDRGGQPAAAAATSGTTTSSGVSTASTATSDPWRAISLGTMVWLRR